jgi:fumarylpyruvate hydrolase
VIDDLFSLEPAPRLDLLDEQGHRLGGVPVGRVFCVGRNYADHAREMGGDPDREPPFFFMKPASAVVTDGVVPWPGLTADLHHEVELVVAVGRSLRNLDPLDCRDAVIGCGVGLDLTRRDLQAAAKAAGRPWEAAKVFDGAAPCGALRAGREVLDAAETRIELEVDGERRQSGCLGQMIHPVDQVLSRLSECFGLRPGDLVFTGTPAGVGPVHRGARLRAHIDTLPVLEVVIA